MKNTDFAHSGLLKLAAKYILPSIMGMLFVMIQSVIDGFYIARFLGENSLASLNIIAPLTSIVMSISLVIGIGSQSLISINLGSNNIKSAQNVFRSGMIACLFFGLIIAVVGVAFPRQIAALMGASAILIEDSSTYLRILSMSAPFMMFWFLFDYTIRVLGKPHISMIAMLASALINIVLDYILIANTSLGMAGAALGTSIAYSVAAMICLIPLLKKKNSVNIFSGKFKWKSLRRIVYNGGSEGINGLSSAVTVLVFNLVLMKYAGEAGVASYTAIMYIMQIGFSVLFGISDGMRPIISYNYGACNNKRLRSSLMLLYILAMTTGLIAFSIIFFFGEALSGLFVSNPDTIAMTVKGAKIVAFAFLFNNVNIATSGFYTSIDFAKESIMISLLRGFLFMLIGVLVLPIFFGVNGVWATFLFADMATIVFVLIIFIVQYKKKKFFPEPSYLAPPEVEKA